MCKIISFLFQHIVIDIFPLMLTYNVIIKAKARFKREI